jgi:HSP20 family protein
MHTSRTKISGPQSIPVNAFTTDEAIVVVAPMPGVVPDDVQIEVRDMQVTLRAALRTDAPKPYFLHEWEYGDYERTIDLPEPVGAPITATLGNGQLAVSLTRAGSLPNGRVVAQPTLAGTSS